MNDCYWDNLGTNKKRGIQEEKGERRDDSYAYKFIVGKMPYTHTNMRVLYLWKTDYMCSIYVMNSWAVRITIVLKI